MNDSPRPKISVVIPVRNGEKTLWKCLSALFSSGYPAFEVIVVDDGSEDSSPDIAAGFPCRVVRLDGPAGTSRARNAGAARASGDVLFFTDADCLVEADALSIASAAIAARGPRTIVGGTYTPIPADARPLSAFQSIFIHYAETKHREQPDYVATHAMVIDRRVFHDAGGFAEDFLPILEDVELSHRLRRTGYALVIEPRLRVRHVFDYSLRRSLSNAMRKSFYWTIYSLGNRDLLSDSGTAGRELKVNVILSGLFAILAALTARSGAAWVLGALGVLSLNVIVNRSLLRAFWRDGGATVGSTAVVYYFSLYPLAVGLGAALGALRYVISGRASPTGGTCTRPSRT